MNYIIKDDKIYRKGTLAHYLDNRAISVGEPTSSDLPKTINAFKFLRDNLLCNNCTILKLKHSQMEYPATLLSLLNELTPAEQAILIYIDIDDLRVPVGLSGASHATGVPTVTCEVDTPMFIDTTVTATTLNERCE